MANLQRARLLAAATEAVEEIGYQRLTVGTIIGRARVSRKTFYDLFANREDCFAAVLEQASGHPRRLATEAYARETCWRKGLRAALETILVLMEEEPGLARLCIVDALSGGPQVLRFRIETVRQIADVIDRGRAKPAAIRDPPAITAEAIVGAILFVLHRRLSQEREEPLTDLTGAFMSMITLPYHGPRAAAQELKKPCSARPPFSERSWPNKKADPLDGLKIRLTYRTVRTLMAIAERPGASNRDAALAAGIADEGQASKLLSRLSRLELIENTEAGQRKGTPNAWRLTVRGERLVRESAHA
jgi:AcrR family transcriptional regulator/DNA-binding MarR family transcriptional regulator